MDIAEAFQIVIDLARENMIDEHDAVQDEALAEQLDRQNEAIKMLSDLAVNEYGDEQAAEQVPEVSTFEELYKETERVTGIDPAKEGEDKTVTYKHTVEGPDNGDDLSWYLEEDEGVPDHSKWKN